MEEKHIIVPYLDESYMFDYIGEGANGTCYKTKDNQVFKKYHSTISNYQDYRGLVGLKSPSFIFPNESVYLEQYGEDYYLGYLMDYIKGSKFSELPMSTNMRDLINKLDILEIEIRDLSIDNRLSIFDMHEDNTILTPDNSIKVLDTDLYSFDYDDLYKNYKNNIRELGLFILGFFLKDYRIIDERLKNYYDLCIYNGKVKPSIILFEVLNEMEKEIKEEIITFNDFYRTKRLLLK